MADIIYICPDRQEKEYLSLIFTLPFYKNLLWIVDEIYNPLLPVPHVSGGLGGQVAEDEQEQLVVVPLVGEIAREVLPHRLHDWVLLGVDEALQHDPHGHVDIVLAHKLPQMHLGVSLSYSDHAFDVPENKCS